MLTLDQIEYYRTHGYLGVENVLTPSELEEARRVVDEFVEKSREVSSIPRFLTWNQSILPNDRY